MPCDHARWHGMDASLHPSLGEVYPERRRRRRRRAGMTKLRSFTAPSFSPARPPPRGRRLTSTAAPCVPPGPARPRHGAVRPRPPARSHDDRFDMIGVVRPRIDHHQRIVADQEGLRTGKGERRRVARQHPHHSRRGRFRQGIRRIHTNPLPRRRNEVEVAAPVVSPLSRPSEGWGPCRAITPVAPSGAAGMGFGSAKCAAPSGQKRRCR